MNGPLVLAWAALSGRTRDFARVLEGEAVCFDLPRLPGPRWAPVRWAVAAVRTVLVLLTRRPRSIVVTNPPVFPALLCLAWSRLTGCRVVLDSHPGGFGEQGDPVARRLQGLHARAAARAAAVLVTEESLAKRVRGWGGHAIVFHEILPPSGCDPAGAPAARPRVLYIGNFQRDEPVQALVEAARAVPDLDITVLGDLRKAPRDLAETAPANLTCPGFLPAEQYRRALCEADVVLVLTTDPYSVVRSGYEAVEAGRVLVLSDTAALRSYFPSAVFVDNTAEGIAAGLAEAVARHDALRAACEPARTAQRDRVAGQLTELRAALSG